MLGINATETSKRDAGWEQAIGICHYEATSDLRGSHPIEEHGQGTVWEHDGLKNNQ